jgi:basic membrane protein A and related proteins
MTLKVRSTLALLVTGVLVAAGCGGDNKSSSGAGATTTAAPATTAAGATTTAAPATTAAGATTTAAAGGTTTTANALANVPPNQPDVNKDGKVKIGVLSPGDTKDHGYYESFVDTAQEFATKNGWELIVVDKINPADAATQARNVCRQGVDMVAIAASELKDAIPVSEEDVCKGTVWYVAGGQGVTQTKFFFQTSDKIDEVQYATGYAAGLAMQALNGKKKAGFITGPELDFSIQAFKGLKAGVAAAVPGAESVATYTGDFNDAAKGQEAARAQISQDVGIIDAYLGGATDAVATVGKQSNVLSVTPGTDRCADPDKRFAVSSIFSPGDYFAAALQDFEKGKVTLGVTRVFRLGVDPVPGVKVCDTVPGAADIQAKVDQLIKDIASGKVDPSAEVAKNG